MHEFGKGVIHKPENGKTLAVYSKQFSVYMPVSGAVLVVVLCEPQARSWWIECAHANFDYRKTQDEGYGRRRL